MDSSDIALTSGRLALLQDGKKIHIAHPRSGEIIWSRELPSWQKTLPTLPVGKRVSWWFRNKQASVFVGNDFLGAFTASLVTRPHEGKFEFFDVKTGRSRWSSLLSALRQPALDPNFPSTAEQKYGVDWSMVTKYLCVSGFNSCPSFFGINPYEVQQTTRIVDVTSGKEILQYQHFGNVPESWVDQAKFKDFRILPDDVFLCRNARFIKAFAASAE